MISGQNQKRMFSNLFHFLLSNFMKQIPLTEWKFAIVDDEDYPFLSRLNWIYREAGGRQVLDTALGSFWAQYIPMHFLLIRQRQEWFVRHKNGNWLDNRKENLEMISASFMQQSKKKPKSKISIYKWVWYQHKKWRAEIQQWGKKYYLWVFASEEAAAEAYNKRARELYGEHAYQNVIE